MVVSFKSFVLACLTVQNSVWGTSAFVSGPSPLTSSHSGKSLSWVEEHQRQPEKSHVLFATGLELVDPSYNLAIGAFGIGLGAGFGEDLRDSNGDKLLTAKPFGALALIFTLFSLFLAFQTTTLRFAFDDDSFSLVNAGGAKLERENVVVGGENKWKYSSFKNYDFLPSRQFPILVYFREDQTPLENREEVPLVVDTLEGQVHFFPAISNSQQLEQGFLKHNCQHLE